MESARPFLLLRFLFPSPQRSGRGLLSRDGKREVREPLRHPVLLGQNVPCAFALESEMKALGVRSKTLPTPSFTISILYEPLRIPGEIYQRLIEFMGLFLRRWNGQACQAR